MDGCNKILTLGMFKTKKKKRWQYYNWNLLDTVRGKWIGTTSQDGKYLTTEICEH